MRMHLTKKIVAPYGVGRLACVRSSFRSHQASGAPQIAPGERRAPTYWMSQHRHLGPCRVPLRHVGLWNRNLEPGELPQNLVVEPEPPRLQLGTSVPPIRDIRLDALASYIADETWRGTSHVHVHVAHVHVVVVVCGLR